MQWRFCCHLHQVDPEEGAPHLGKGLAARMTILHALKTKISNFNFETLTESQLPENSELIALNGDRSLVGGDLDEELPNQRYAWWDVMTVVGNGLVSDASSDLAGAQHDVIFSYPHDAICVHHPRVEVILKCQK